MKKYHYLTLIAFLMANLLLAQPNYRLINPFFKKYVAQNGMVDFKKLVKNKEELSNTLAILTDMPPQEEWHRNEKLAYWLNVYNLQMLKTIVENYPVKSILDINNGKLWQEKCVKVGLKTYCLDEIENDIIRRELKEPRIHFAFFSGSVSSPILLNEVFTPANMNLNFEILTKRYINSSLNVISERKLELSSIFKWYASDFKDIVAFVNQYSKVKVQADAEVSYIDFNWNLKE
jgi:hypothetical protein